MANPRIAQYYHLKGEFPRLPFYEAFWQWAAWGKQLMVPHFGYEAVAAYPLESDEQNPQGFKNLAGLGKAPKAGIIHLDEQTSLHGIPSTAWEYKLGNRSALEWILDQYKEKKPKDKTIAEKFNTYRFADYKQQVIDLLQRVCTVSVETMKVVREMGEMK